MSAIYFCLTLNKQTNKQETIYRQLKNADSESKLFHGLGSPVIILHPVSSLKSYACKWYCTDWEDGIYTFKNIHNLLRMTMIKVREATNWGWVHGRGGSRKDKVENDKINYILNSNRKKKETDSV